MLTIKAPIQLHIAQGLTQSGDAFGERIRGNYGMLGARYTPKDLLFLLIAPPELPEEMGGMTTLVSQQNSVDVRSVTMDVVNNVVNRIMLDGTQQFTYQDQVYITSVLNRLGVTNVAQFMEQIRQLRTENESTLQLTKLYRAELERVIQRQEAGEEAPALPISGHEDGDAPRGGADPRVSMSLDILRRLDTTKLYETVHSFQRNWSRGDTYFQNNEFRLAEQVRFSNSVSLAQIKQQVYEQPQLNLLHHLNRYETSVVMETPKDEEAVLSQAAAAALVSAVDNTVTEVLSRPQLRQEQWLHIENAISQTAENTLSRFETYHSQYQQPVQVTMPDVQKAWNHYAQELQEYRALYQQMYPKAAEHGRVIGLPGVTKRELLHLTSLEQVDEVRQILNSGIELNQEQRQTLLQAIMLAPRAAAEKTVRETQPGLRVREERGYELERRMDRERIEQMLQSRAGEGTGAMGEQIGAPRDAGSGAAGMPAMVLTDREVESVGEELSIEQMEQIEQFNRTLVQNVAREIQRVQDQKPSAAEHIHQTTVLPGEGEAARVQLTGREEPEEGAVLTGEHREYIDQSSRKVLRELHQDIEGSLTRITREGDVAHRTTVLPGEMGIAPVKLTDRETPEEGVALTEEYREYIDQSSRKVLQELYQDIEGSLTQITREGDVAHRTTVLPGEMGMEPVKLTGREVPEEGAALDGEHREYIDQSSRKVLQELRQEMGGGLTQITREGDVLHQTTVLPGETGMVPVKLTGREKPEDGAALTGEHREYIDRSSRTEIQDLRQEIRDVKVEQTSLTENLVQNQAVVKKYTHTNRTVPSVEVGEVLRQLRPQEGEQAAESIAPSVSLTGREEPVPGMTVEEIEYLDQRSQSVLQELRQEIDRSQTQLKREGDVLRQTTLMTAEAGALSGRGGEQAVRETLRQLRADGQEARYEVASSPVTMTAREAEEQAPELLAEQIERIEARNRTLLQTLQQKTREREVVLPGGPDMRRTMRDALRSLEEPQQVLREIYSRQEADMVHPAFTPEEEEVLQRVDPASRAVYEQILAYQKDPEGTLAKGLIKPVSMGTFQAEIRQAMQEMPLELEHQSPEARRQTELIREQSEIILEKFHRMPAQSLREEPLRQPAAVKIVHKAVAPDVTEELLEQLEQNRIQNTVTTVSKDEVTRSQTHQMDVKQVEQKIVTQTTEDITELVNRTLARQMRTISDQVYRQMEKRLQSERSRRGRF